MTACEQQVDPDRPSYRATALTTVRTSRLMRVGVSIIMTYADVLTQPQPVAGGNLFRPRLTNEFTQFLHLARAREGGRGT